VKKESGTIAFGELSAGEQAAAVKKRLKGYSLKVYKSSKKTVSEKKVDTVCMREDPFYVDTVNCAWKYNRMELESKSRIATAGTQTDFYFVYRHPC